MNKHEGKYAWSATVGEKGQIVIPKQARELFDIHPGDTLVFESGKVHGCTALCAGSLLDVFTPVREDFLK